MVLAALAGLVGCAGGREEIPTRPHDQVRQQVEQHAAVVRTAVGADSSQASTQVRPCLGQAGATPTRTPCTTCKGSTTCSCPRINRWKP